MICPLDGQPCTGDHSGRCYSQCEEEKRRIPRVPVREFIESREEPKVATCPDCGHFHICRSNS